MIRAARIRAFGGPEVIEFTDTEPGEPGPGQVRVAHRAIGLNMVDTYYRSGLYPLDLPSGLGGEAAGVVVSAGRGVAGFAPGDRVAYAAPAPLDGYAQERLIDARWLVKLPDAIDDRTAAAMMLKGLTGWCLLRRSYAVRPGDWILLYAAAGGVGSIAGQWAAHLGAHVIGVVGGEPKRDAAAKNGCEIVLLAGEEDFAARVRELSGGGVVAVYDSIGRDTFYQSLDCLRPHGFMVSFGNASGPVEPVAPLELMRRGSLYLTRPRLYDFIGTRAELDAASAALFDVVASGAVSVHVQQTYPLGDAAEAHRDLEARRTTGSTVLLP
jgi:NADPH2:quinone reductase